MDRDGSTRQASSPVRSRTDGKRRLHGSAWTLFLAAFEKDEDDGRAAFGLVLDEMLHEFDRLETRVDARREWVLGMLQSVGFTVDPAGPRWSGDLCHRVWLARRAVPHFHAPN